MDTIPFLQVLFAGIAAVAAVIAALFAYQIGTRQNELSELQDFAEVFLMPQTLIKREVSGAETVVGWRVLIKNASSYPIYLNAYTLNGVKKEVGSSAIPRDTDSWYNVPIPVDVQQRGEFSLIVEFEDYRGRKYITEGFGKFHGQGWEINSRKRIEVK